MNASVWIIILAAGFSRRMGEPKILLPIDNEPLIRFMSTKALSIKGSDGVIVVLNDIWQAAKRYISDLPLTVVLNDRAYKGMSTSLKLGINHLPRSATAAMIWLADQPELDPVVAEELIEKYKQNRSLIIQPAYQGKPSHPVLFDQRLFEDLQEISGDQGGRSVIEENKNARLLVPFSYPPPKDLDTKEDYEQFMMKRRYTI